MSGGRVRRSGAAAAPAKDAPTKEAPSPNKAPGKRIRPSEAETAADDAARDAADLEDATETSHKLPPQGLLQRRLDKSKESIQQLQSEKAAVQQKLDELQKKVDEEAKAGKLA